MTDPISLIAQMMRYDTRTNRGMIGKDVKRLLEEVIEPQLIEFGFEVEYILSNGHWSILGKRKGDDPKIFLSGHVDVVPWIRELWDSDPQELLITEHGGEEVIIGRGVSDMLSGVAAIICALPSYPKDATIYIGITGDEEVGGEDGTGIIIDKLKERDELPHYVITGDAAGMEIINRRRNIFDVDFKCESSIVRMRGRLKTREFKTSILSAETSHAAYFNRDVDIHCVKLMADFITDDIHPVSIDGKFVKVNAIPPSVELTYLVEDPEGELHDVDIGLRTIINLAGDIMNAEIPMEKPSSYGLNITPNVISFDGYWDLQVDIRAMISKESMVIEEVIDELIANCGITYEIFKSVGYVFTDTDTPLVQASASVLHQMGYQTTSQERGGATDGRFFGQYNIPTIDIGSIGAFEHGPNERSTIKSIRDLVSFFEVIIPEIINFQRGG